MRSPLGLPLRSGLEEARTRRAWSHLSPHLEVADDTVRLGFVQPTGRGHGELPGSADEKVAGGRVAAALRAAVAELGFLSTHLGSAQGCGRVRRQGRAKAGSGPQQRE